MNQIKKLAGIIWLLLGPASIYFIVRAAAHEIAVKPGVDTVIQWGVFVVIFILGQKNVFGGVEKVLDI